jgi:hypothetical protein
VGKIAEDALESVSNEPWDVLNEDVEGSYLANDASDFRPEPTGVINASAIATGTERLAREAGRDEIHSATIEFAREALEIVPDRCRIQGRLLHPHHEHGRCEGVPLTVTHAAKLPSQGHREPQFEPSNPCT